MSQTLEQRLTSLATTIGAVSKNHKVKMWDLTTLTTTEKNTLVGAINEVKWLIGSMTQIDDANSTTTSTYSSDKTFTDPQKSKARDNIGAASQTDLTTLTNNIGNTDHDFVADFNTAYN